MITNELLNKCNLWDFSEQCVLAVANNNLNYLTMCERMFPDSNSYILKLIRAWRIIIEYYSDSSGDTNPLKHYVNDDIVNEIAWYILGNEVADERGYVAILRDSTIDYNHRQYFISVLKVLRAKYDHAI